jgi:predicted TPR repeat methyltransferase
MTTPLAPPAGSPADFEGAKRAFLDGLAHLQAGRLDAAEAAFEVSLALLPGRPSTLVNLAATRLALGKPAPALEAADAALAAEPDSADACLQRARALTALGRHADALAAFDRLVALKPEIAPFWTLRGETLERLGRVGEALQSHDRALTLDATHAPAWSRRGGLLREMGRLAEAATAYEQAIAHGLDDELHRHYLAAVRGGASTHAPRAYVQALFDDYAAEFDAHLQALGYRAPATLERELQAAVGPRRFPHALDLGCGTGLCGHWMKARADQLCGVDLSAAMLDQARALACYDELLQADVAEHLAASNEPLDLVVAADVFIYVGELGAVFASVAQRLRPGGVFAFSVERAPADAPGVQLQPSLRYAHSAAYVRALAAQQGLRVLRWLEAPIREDQRESIPGLYVLLEQPAA